MNRVTRKTVLALVAYPARDLEGIGLLAFHLRRWYNVELVPALAEEFEQKMLELAPDAILLDQLGSEHRMSLARLAVELGSVVCLLPVAGYLQTAEAEITRAGKKLGSRQVVDLYFAWGEAGRSLLLEDEVFSPEQIVAVGSPRFDFYYDPLRKLLPTRTVVEQRIRIRSAGGRPFILFLSACWSRRSKEVGKHQDLPKAEREDLEQERAIFSDIISSARHIAERHPDWNVVLKIHPAEDATEYRTLSRDCSNVYIVQDIAVRDLIHSADAVVQRNSTTAPEAWMLGKPVVELCISPSPFPPRPETEQGCDVVRTLEQTDAVLQGYVGGWQVPSSQQAARVQNLHAALTATDGGACERIGAALSALLLPAGGRRQKKAEGSARRERSRTQNVGVLARHALGLPSGASLRFWTSGFWRRRDQHNAVQKMVATLVNNSGSYSQLWPLTAVLPAHGSAVMVASQPAATGARKCLFVIEDHPIGPDVSGMGACFYSRLGMLHDAGLEVIVLVLQKVLQKHRTERASNGHAKRSQDCPRVATWYNALQELPVDSPERDRAPARLFFLALRDPGFFLLPVINQDTVDQVRRTIEEVSPDVIWAEHLVPAALIARTGLDIPVVYAHHDWEWKLAFRRARDRRLRRLFETMLFRRFERKLVRSVSGVLSSSWTESCEIKAAGAQQVAHIPVTYDQTGKTSEPVREGPMLVHLGGMSATANRIGLHRFLQVVWPELSRRLPLLQLRVVGDLKHAGAPLMAALRDPQIETTGHAGDLNVVLRAGDIHVIPWEHNTGTRTRVPIALRHGQVIVGVRRAVAGNPELVSGENCLLSEDLPGLAKLIEQVALDSALRFRLSEAATRTFAQHFTREAVQPRFNQFVRTVVESYCHS